MALIAKCEAGRTLPPLQTTHGIRKSFAASFMISLLPDGEGNGQAIARRRQRAGGIRRVRAGRILEMIEIQHQLAGLLQSLRWKTRVKKTARSIGCGGAGCVAKNEEKFHRWIIFDDRLNLVGPSLQCKFRSPRHRL